METQIMVEFAVYGDSFNPNELTELLGISPTLTYMKGDVIIRPENKSTVVGVRYRKETVWEYSTGYIETPYVEEVLEPVLNIFSSKARQIRDFVDKHSLSTKLEVVPKIYNDITPALYFNQDVIDFLHTVRACIDIDMYVN